MSDFIFNLLVAITAVQAFVLPNTNEIESVEEDVQLGWFEQPIDHFNIQDKRTFLMRYLENDVFFKPGGPLLLEIGGESDISPLTIKQSQSYELAKQLSGKIIVLEHRYYGKSSPFKNLTAKNLVYLNVEQALEDIANFVDTLKKTRAELRSSKVAAFGCSYSGSLATWFRYKYPHLVNAVWASSAPLRAVADFYEYLEVAGEVYSNISQRCYNTIKNGYIEIKQLLSTPKGEKQIKLALENWSCGNASEMTATTILTNIRYVIADHNIPPDHGSTSCNILQNVNSSSLQALLLFLKIKSPDVCTDEDETYPNNEVAWSYQTCTEFGFSITMSSHKQPFDDSYSVIDEDMASCLDFGKEFTLERLKKGINRINRNYGSQDIKVSKVLSVHGAQDPWHKLGLYNQKTADSPVIMIPGVSHCADQLYQDNESSQLTKAKKQGREILTKWLQN
ncbi:hypothetical protein RN001_010470 [Aquatica leii]|uniref:Serine protease K12H4.7 n=1 Tax=Aquatica leii TaxID=1421715 RepID=A0AAN7SG13_9COLE|nr:hypothetical protein RN001_010470 [Aquatica leii]